MTCFSTWSYYRFIHLSQCVISKFMPSARNSRICKWNHCEAVSWTSVTFWNLHCDVCSGNSIRCEVRAVQWMIKTFPYKLLQQGCHLLGCVGSWHQVTFIFLVLCRSILVVTYSKLLWKCNKLPQGVPIHQAQNSVLKITFTDTMWQMLEPSRWLCGKVGHCFLFSRELLFWTKNFWRSKHALHILTFQSTLVAFKQEPLIIDKTPTHALFIQHYISLACWFH